MSHATIYDMASGYTITDGLQSSIVCDEARLLARQIAKERRRSVVVEDRGDGSIYRVTPAGHIWRVPRWWELPDWY